MTDWDIIAKTKSPMRAAWDDDRTNETERHVRFITERLGDVTDAILDFGVGPGRLAIPVHELTGVDVIGVDTSPLMIDPYVRATNETPGLYSALIDATNSQPWPTDWFDGVYSMLTFQHMTHTNVERAMDTIAGAMQPGCRFVAQFTVGDTDDTGPLSHPWFTSDEIAGFMRTWLAHVTWQHDPVEPSWVWVWGDR